MCFWLLILFHNQWDKYLLVFSFFLRTRQLIVLLSQAGVEENCEPMWLGKTNFVEIRSFWQIFRSFDRMWSFYILCLQVCSELTTSGLSLHHPYSQFSYDFFSPFQAMIIMACHDLESPLQVFDADVFEDIMSIFITSAILKLIQGRGTCSYFTHYWIYFRKVPVFTSTIMI